jgi:hypothetical protein
MYELFLSTKRFQDKINRAVSLPPSSVAVVRCSQLELQTQNISHRPINSFVIVVNYLKTYSHFSSILLNKSLSSSMLPKDKPKSSPVVVDHCIISTTGTWGDQQLQGDLSADAQ